MTSRLVPLLWAAAALAQTARVEPAEPLHMPGQADSSSPGHWHNGWLHLFNSNGMPVRSEGTDLQSLRATRAVLLDRYDHAYLWIESTWQDADGKLYAWYHHEDGSVCVGGVRSVPRIGALVSYNQGASFHDLGIVLDNGDQPDCEAGNGYFAAGHGDFSVVLDREKKYFYFLFTNYGGDVSFQGIATARMAFEDRDDPVGKVWKYSRGDWKEPGLGGPVTPVFMARSSWMGAEPDSYWGAAVHFNTYLNRFVMLLNRACCDAEWPQEGVYVSFNADPAKPGEWTRPQKILDTWIWYPLVFGTGEGETDKEAGRSARLFMGAYSEWEIVFEQ